MVPQQKIKNILVACGKTLSTAESCTGGQVASALTSVPGASEYFQGGIVAYQNSVKTKELGVRPEDISAYDVVSRQVVEQMVRGACARFGTHYALATTGYADKGNERVADGTIWIGWGSADDVHSHCLHLGGTREDNTAMARDAVLEHFLDFLGGAVLSNAVLNRSKIW